MGRNRRVTSRFATIAAALVLSLFVAGCIGIKQSPEVIGRVKIVDATSIALSQLRTSLSGGTAPTAGSAWSDVIRFSGAPHDVEPTYEYIVYLQPRADVHQFRLAAHSLGFQYQETSDQYHIVKDHRRRPVADAIWLLSSLNQVSGVEENGKIVLLDTDLSLDLLAASSLSAKSYWAHEQIRIEEAWDIAGHGDGVVVAVVDTGIDFTHPALAHETMWVEGRDFVTNPLGEPYGYNDGNTRAAKHGTIVAGIVGARAFGPGSAVSGVAPQVKIMPLRVFDNFGRGGTEAVLANAIKYAIENGADVINLSLGKNNGDDCAPILQSALNEAWAAGLTVVASTGNQGSPAILCPARHPTVISVGASNAESQRTVYSNYGETLDLLAPGGEGSSCETAILAPTLNGGVSCSDTSVSPADVGTSYAAPHVSGVAALMLAQGAATRPDDVKHVLQMTALDVGKPGYDEETGYGVVDAYLAVSSGVPRVFAARLSGDTLRVAGQVALAGEGGAFRLAGVPEGVWTVVGWVDTDGDGVVSTGDFYGAYNGVVVRDGRSIASIDFQLLPYVGEERAVVY